MFCCGHYTQHFPLRRPPRAYARSRGRDRARGAYRDGVATRGRDSALLVPPAQVRAGHS